MRTIAKSILLLAAAAAGCLAQQWEFGGAGGGGFLNTVSVSAPLAGATAGFQNGPGFDAFFGQTIYSRLSGELHYGLYDSDLKLSSAGSSATFSGVAQVVYYDLVLHTNRASRTQFFVAGGGGMKLFDGTGREQAYQPLSQFGYFTKTHSIKPMGDVGVGLRYALTARLSLRLELHDYLTGFPTQVLTPAPGTHYGSILQDFVPTVGLGYQY